MSPNQHLIEQLSENAQHLPDYAPWTTTIGAAIDATHARADAGLLNLDRTAFSRAIGGLTFWGFKHEMTISEARKRAREQAG